MSHLLTVRALFLGAISIVILGVAPFVQASETPVVISSFTMETDPGWTTEGQWEFGQPQGSGGDPASGFTGDNVYGYNLAGKYSNNMPIYWLTSSPIDCSYYTNTVLSFRRWLRAEISVCDHAYIEASNDGKNWTRIWTYSGSIADSSWKEVSYDLSSVADHQDAVYLRWGMGTTDSSVTYGGWNIDDVEISGEPAYRDTISVSLPNQFTEGDGAQPDAGSVSVLLPASTNRVIALSADIAREVILPVDVVIPAGKTNATFDITVLQDPDLDGTQAVTVLAEFPRYKTGEASTLVHDDETATLSISLPQTSYEGAGEIAGAVIVNQTPNADVVVELTSNNPSKIGNGQAVIPAGQTLGAFTLPVYDDTVMDGIQTATIEAHVENWQNDSASVFVFDDETNGLTIQLPDPITEGDGALTNGASVSIPATAIADIHVLLTSSDASKLDIPYYVTIPAGTNQVSFDVTVGDDTETAGSTPVTVMAQSPNYIPDSATGIVRDNDAHHLTVEGLESDIPLADTTEIVITAKTADDLTITDFSADISLAATGDRGAVSVTPAVFTNMAGGIINSSVSFGTIGNDITLTASGGGISGTSTLFHVTASQIAISPTNPANTVVAPGASLTRTMVISNSGNADLEFDIQVLKQDIDPIDAGLIAHYPFNGNATDESGNGHDGTVNGATLSADRFGHANSAYAFDGTGSFIEVADSESLRLANTDYTISLWFEETTRSTSHNHTLMAKRSSGSQNGWLYTLAGDLAPNANGTIKYHLSGGYDPFIASTATAPLGQWTHAVIIYDHSAQTIRCYINGLLDSEHADMPSPNPSAAVNLIIGRDSASSNYGFHGSIDDIRIYNRALSDAEVQNLAGKTIDTTLIAYYPFNGNATDESGNGHDGTVTGAALTADRFGNPNSAYHFDGDSDVISIADHADFTVSNVSICAWIKTQDKSDHKHITSCYNTSYYADWYNLALTKDTGTARWAADPGGNVTVPVAIGTTDLADNSWHFIVAVRDTAGGQLYAYVDGVLQSSAADIYGGLLNPSADFWIGGRASNSSLSFNGDIDDVRIYNRVLTGAEIEELYTATEETSWLTVDPLFGTVSPGSSTNVSVTFSAAGLTAGTMCNATLNVLCNDPIAPTNSMEASMSVVVEAIAPTAVIGSADEDSDGLADEWEREYFGTTSVVSPTADADGDGLSNLDEYIAGTSPEDKTSFFSANGTAENGGSGPFVIQWNAVPGRTYSVEWAPAAGAPFQPLATGLEYPQNSYTDTVHSAESTGFYKVTVELK